MTSNELSKLPEYLSNVSKEDMGYEHDAEYFRPSRLKTIMPQSKEPYNQFDEGSLVLTPDMSLVAKKDELIHFVPLFCYPEYALWNDYRVTAKDPSQRIILEQTLDKDSELARKARNNEEWTASHPDVPGMTVRYCEHLVCIAMLKGEYWGSPVAISWFRTNHKQGVKFANLRLRRKSSGVPMYACVYEAKTLYAENEMGKWYELPVSNPTDDTPPILQSEEEFKLCQMFYNQLKEDYNRNAIQIDYTDEGVVKDESKTFDSEI